MDESRVVYELTAEPKSADGKGLNAALTAKSQNGIHAKTDPVSQVVCHTLLFYKWLFAFPLKYFAFEKYS
jgi:hypothetical protein